jgi:hypothetical protein
MVQLPDGRVILQGQSGVMEVLYLVHGEDTASSIGSQIYNRATEIRDRMRREYAP